MFFSPLIINDDLMKKFKCIVLEKYDVSIREVVILLERAFSIFLRYKLNTF